jgi:hypothetical protein
VDSTINRVHQHATNLPRGDKPSPRADHADGDVAQPAGSAGIDATVGVVAGLLTGDTGGRAIRRTDRAS